MCFCQRTTLAALHFNYNVRREPRKDHTGRPKVVVNYPKYKYGEGTVKESKVEQNYGMSMDIYSRNKPLNKMDIRH